MSWHEVKRLGKDCSQAKSFVQLWHSGGKASLALTLVVTVIMFTMVNPLRLACYNTDSGWFVEETTLDADGNAILEGI